MDENSKDVQGANVEQDQAQKQPKMYSEDELNEKLKAQRKEINENNQTAWNKRWGYEKSEIEKDNAKKDELIDLLMRKTKTGNLDELLDTTYENYGETRPENKRISLKDDEILGKHDAKEILELDLDSIIQKQKKLEGISRSTRQEIVYKELTKHIQEVSQKEKIKREIQECGIEETILENPEFMEFLGNFKEGVSMKTIYDTYQKTKVQVEKPTEDVPKDNNKPFTPGSMKNTYTEAVIKEYYTPEEAKKLRKEDYLKNPKLSEIVERSRLSWMKR